MAKLKKSFPGKKILKLSVGKCQICGEDSYETLNVHRIKHGSDGGKYDVNNVSILCSNCHALHHAGVITILGIVDSTAGKLLHWKDEQGNEQFS